MLLNMDLNFYLNEFLVWTIPVFVNAGIKIIKDKNIIFISGS
jgi:hypothetical protein